MPATRPGCGKILPIRFCDPLNSFAVNRLTVLLPKQLAHSYHTAELVAWEGFVTPWLMAEGRNQRVQGDNPQTSLDANSKPFQRLVRRGSDSSGLRYSLSP